MTATDAAARPAPGKPVAPPLYIVHKGGRRIGRPARRPGASVQARDGAMHLPSIYSGQRVAAANPLAA